MISTLRALFLRCALREKLLLVAFVAIGAVIWISSFSSRAGAFWRTKNVTSTQLKDQENWLARRTKVEAAAQKAAAQLDSAKTLDATRLFTTVRQLALDAGIPSRNVRNEGPSPQISNGLFSVNTLGIRIDANDADGPKNWEAVKKFYVLLQERSPYISINQFILQPVPRNPGMLTLVLKVSSPEVH